MQENQSYLERVRIHEGNTRCMEFFEQACVQSQRRAAAMINDEDLTFPTLYLLYSSIRPRQLFLNLNQRNQQMIHILTELKKDKTGNGKVSILAKKQLITHSNLKWAVKTGYQFDGNTNYDFAIDTFICVLLITYRDKEMLPYAEHLIFARHRDGKGIHDLVWAYFHHRDIRVLKQMAEHLQSNDSREAELAAKLLDTGRICRGCENAQSGYTTYLKWLEENEPYLFFTGENMFFSRRPTICKVDQERKYRQRNVRAGTEEPE